MSLKAGDRIGLNTKDSGKKERLAIAVHIAARSDACAVNSDVKIVWFPQLIHVSSNKCRCPAVGISVHLKVTPWVAPFARARTFSSSSMLAILTSTLTTILVSFILVKYPDRIGLVNTVRYLRYCSRSRSALLPPLPPVLPRPSGSAHRTPPEYGLRVARRSKQGETRG